MRAKKLSVQEKKLQKREAIVKSAIEIFGQKGFHNAKIGEIAKRAKVADGTVYLYFKNKDDLMIQAMKELLHKKLTYMKRILSVEKRGVKKLYKFYKMHAAMFTGDINVARFITVELRQCKEFYEKYPEFTPISEYIDFVEEIIKQAIAEGDIVKDIDPRIYAMMFLGTVDFVITQWVLGKSEISLDDTVEQIAHLFRLNIEELEI